MLVGLETLNDNQRRAVEWNDGPMLVLAGPGSGKTRVLSMRVARLIEQDPDASVLALTFTNKAAAEMRERVDHLFGRRADRAHLCTFHSYATELLRQHGSHVGLRPDFTILTSDEDRLALLRPVASKLDESEQLPTDPRSMLRLLEHLFRELYDGGSEGPGLTTTPQWVPPLFERYCAALVENNRQDFPSLLHFASLLLREKRGVARVARIGWSHVCVDEFQDTNKAQYELLKLLVPTSKGNLFVVGDDDQIIYQWNGASPERLQALRRDYDMEVVQLPKSYRCPSEIIALANRLIQHNQLRTDGKKPLIAHHPPSPTASTTIRFQEFNLPSEEWEFVASDIQARGQDAKECVVLARTTRLLQGAASALQSVGLTPYLARRRTDFESGLARVLLQALRLANARHDREILRRLCVAWKDLTDSTIELEDVAASATLVGGDFLRAWATIASKRPGTNVRLLDRLRTALVDRLDFPDIVDWFLQEDWADFGDDLHKDIKIWRKSHDAYLSENRMENVTLNGYLQSMDLTAKVPPRPKEAVSCLTVHGSKGLEFKHVYLIGMSQEVLPSFQALKQGPNSREVEEERRNCFVAITRAEETLTLTRSEQYYGRPKGPSQFLDDMGLLAKSRSGVDESDTKSK